MIPSTTEQPGGRAPAPGALGVVQLFVNSVDLEDDTDQLATTASMRRWFAELGLEHAGLDDADRGTAVRLREGVRDLVDARDDRAHPGPQGFGELVDELGLRLVYRDGRFRLSGDTAIGRALAPVVDGIRTGIDDGTWPRLKVCERDTCRWLFYDHSKNHASRWCASSICGSREKARRAYARRTART